MGYNLNWHESEPDVLVIEVEETTNKDDLSTALDEAIKMVETRDGSAALILNVSKRPTPPPGTLAVISSFFRQRPAQVSQFIVVGTDRVGQSFGKIFSRVGVRWMRLVDTEEEALEIVREGAG